MPKYYATYKCALCGKLIRYGNAQEVPKEMLPELLGKVIRNQQFAGNPYLYIAPMHIPHSCENGNAGIAQFAGFTKDLTKE